MKFLELEGAYLAIGIFILIITTYVTTRPFVGKNAFKIGFPMVFFVLAFFIIAHYIVTTNRMETAEKRFESGKPIICENREQRKVSPSIIIIKRQGWEVKENVFVNPEYSRGFHSARCLELFNEEFPEEEK
jgi:hypothetical protein